MAKIPGTSGGSSSSSPSDASIESLLAVLKDVGLTDDNRAKWGALAGTLVGAFVALLQDGLILLIQAPAVAIDRLLSTITGTFDGALSSLTNTISREIRLAWQPFDLGVFSLPVNMGVVLLTLGIVVTVAVAYYRWVS